MKVIAVIIAVVATIYTAGAAAGLMAGTSGALGFGTAMAAGAAVFTGAAGLTAAAVGAAAIGGAAGSIASQGVLIAGGVQDSFDWKSVGLSAIGAAATAGLGGVSGGISNGLGVTSNAGQALVGGGVNSAVTAGVGSALDATSFSWKSVAASAVAAGVGYGANKLIGRMQYSADRDWMSQDGSLQQVARSNDWGQTAVRQFGSGMAAGAAGAAARGNLSNATLTQIGPDALGSTVGNSIADRAATSSVANALQGRDVDSLRQMDRLVRNIDRDPAALSTAEWDVVARAGDTSGPTGQWLSRDAIRGRTGDFLKLGGLSDSQVDVSLGLYARAGLIDRFGSVGALEAVSLGSVTTFNAPATAASLASEGPGTWLGEAVDQSLIGVGYAGRTIAEQIDGKPWLKVAAVGLEVVAGPAKFALNQAVQHTFVGELISSATEAAVGYVGGKLSAVGHADQDATDGGIGALTLGSLAAMGPLAVVKKIGDVVKNAAGDSFAVARHMDMPSPRPGYNSHHGVMSAWMEKRFPSLQVAETRLADLQRLLAQQTTQLQELQRERADGHVRFEALAAELAQVRTRAEAAAQGATVERDTLLQQIRGNEERSAAEIDRARQETKRLQAEARTAVRQHQQALATARQHGEALERDLQVARRQGDEQRVRAEALEQQLARLADLPAQLEATLQRVRPKATPARTTPRKRTKRGGSQ